MKNSSRLRTITDLRPVLRNATRWSSCFEMLKRFITLYEIISAPINEFEFTDEIAVRLADVGLLHEVEALVNSQQRAQNITLWLQQSNYEMVSLMTVRRQFDSLIEVYPSFHYHLAANANIVHNKTFESAVQIQMFKPSECNLCYC